MKRAFFSIISFFIFVIELIVQMILILGSFASALYNVVLLCLVRYHNRIQLWTTKRNFLVVEEAQM